MLPTKTFLTTQYQFTQDFFCDNNLKISKVMECLEDISGEHAKSLGFGLQDMTKNNLMWMISKAKLSFEQTITQPQRVNITTWPVANRRFFCNRYYVATDTNGKVLFRGVYVWLIVDKSTRSIASAQQLAKMYRGDFDDATPQMDLTFTKVNYDYTFQHVYTQQILPCHLDVNNHVNNTHYVEFATLGEGNVIRQVEIVFQHELLVNQSVDIFKKQTENTAFVCGIKADGTISFTAKYIC